MRPSQGCTGSTCSGHSQDFHRELLKGGRCTAGERTYLAPPRPNERWQATCLGLVDVVNAMVCYCLDCCDLGLETAIEDVNQQPVVHTWSYKLESAA
ncbi:MAG: hypothetical protein USCAAHI_02090 [Beijerinckiaceae bacterium]|nr:MAG: hypothetical protein USCAAHI_02090 [Beijerinckiaceae bacterium]